MLPSLYVRAGREEAASDGVPFTKRLCRAHRVWAVDATTSEALPVGWQQLARTLFDRIAAVMVGRAVGMLVVRALGEESGGLAADICPVGVTGEAARAFRSVERLIERARRTSEETCAVCGEPGRLRSTPGRYATRCDAHAEELPALRDGRIELATVVHDHDPHIHGAGAADGRDPSAATAVHCLYNLADVEAALGRRRGALPRGMFDGDPDAMPAPTVDTDHQAFLRGLFDLGEAGCSRALARPEPTSLAGLDDLQERAPHMVEVTTLVRRHLRAAMTMDLPVSLPALMLVGEPGVGKTWFMARLAKLLGLPHRRYPMSGQSLADGLAGGHPTWRNARPGLVARCLLAEPFANPLLLVDEVDKAGAHANEDPYRAFYDLLEPEGAREFIDEYLGFRLDASRVLWVLAGNEPGPIPPPILDRLTVVSVPVPGEAHLRSIVDSVYAECNAARRSYFSPLLDEATISRLLGTNPRGMRRAIGEAMTTAAADGRRAITPDDLVFADAPRRIGFR